jgi:carbon-monoxide dehydrogenase medium subunit
VKPASFDYHAPASIADATEVLARADGDASILAGGQSLVPLLNMRIARPGTLVDLRRIGDLAYIEERDGGLAVGAMTRQRTVHESQVVKERCPLLHEALGLVGHVPIRSRGTVGGSIAHADPAAELPAVLVALSGTVTLASSSGERTVDAEDFFKGFLTTAVEPGELVREVFLPATSPGSGSCFVEVARRHGDFALAGVGAQITLDGQTCIAVGLGLNGVGATPCRPHEAERRLTGEPLTDDAIGLAAQTVKESVKPTSDIHAAGEFRAHLAGVLTKRALTTARQRAMGERE